jgi:hypothetical protein
MYIITDIYKSVYFLETIHSLTIFKLASQNNYLGCSGWLIFFNTIIHHYTSKAPSLKYFIEIQHQFDKIICL